MTHPFDKHLQQMGDLDEAVRVTAKQLSFEHRMVELLIRVFCESDAKRHVYEVQREQQVDSRRMHLWAFNRLFEDFPFVLGAFIPPTAVHSCQKSTEPARYKKFMAVPFVKAYRDLAGSMHDMDVRNPCLIVPRKGLINGLCVYEDSNMDYWKQGLVQIYRGNNKGRLNERVFVIRPFDSLLGDMKVLRKWIPQENN